MQGMKAVSQKFKKKNSDKILEGFWQKGSLVYEFAMPEELDNQ